MMDEDVLIVIGTLGGAALGAAGALISTFIGDRSSRRRWMQDRRDMNLQRIQEAGVDYIRSVESYVAALQAMPFRSTPPGWTERVVDRILGESVNVFVLIFQRLLYGYRWERLLDAAVAASARLRVVAPTRLRSEMDRVQEFLASDPDFASDATTQRWRDVREGFVRVLQEQAA